MEISENYKKKIIEELQFIIYKMNGCTNIEEALYYYSGTRALIKRIFNLEYNPHLIHIHFILNSAFPAIAGLVDLTKRGSTVTPISIDFFQKMAQLLKSLTELIEKGEFTYKILEKISILTYSITGNGYYLQQQGVKMIDF